MEVNQGGDGERTKTDRLRHKFNSGSLKVEMQRKDDSRIDRIEKLVEEIHQRQIEVTIPGLEGMKKTLYGNGKPGLCETVTKLDTKITMTAWVLGLAISIIGASIAFLELFVKK